MSHPSNISGQTFRKCFWTLLRKMKINIEHLTICIILLRLPGITYQGHITTGLHYLEKIKNCRKLLSGYSGNNVKFIWVYFYLLDSHAPSWMLSLLISLIAKFVAERGLNRVLSIENFTLKRTVQIPGACNVEKCRFFFSKSDITGGISKAKRPCVARDRGSLLNCPLPKI